jgi:hypothetical protein
MIKLYALYDNASKTTQHPMPFLTDRDAVDGLKEVCLDKNTAMNKHPEDFTLYRLGSYNPREMSFDMHEQPEIVITVSEILQ